MKKILVLIVLGFSIFAKEAVDPKTKKLLIKSLETNEKLHESYFSYDVKKVVDVKKDLVKSLAKVEHKKIKPIIKNAIKYLKKIANSNSRDDNNKYYHFANVYLIRVINKFDLGEKYQAYYCPMVRKKWIQDISKKEKVHNPYDPTMPHCGGRL